MGCGSKAVATRSGDLAEIDGLDERSPVIPLVTSTRDNCLGQECPEPPAVVVGEAASAVQALTWLATQRCDLLLLDVHMPGRDGTQLADELRQRIALLEQEIGRIRSEIDRKEAGRKAADSLFGPKV